MKNHHVGWCTDCHTFTHLPVRPYTAIIDNCKVQMMLCPKCRKARLDAETTAEQRKIYCAYCGVTKGNNIYPVLIEQLRFDEERTCNFYIGLCEKCRKIPHSTIRKKLHSSFDGSICHEEPNESWKDYKGMHHRAF